MSSSLLENLGPGFCRDILFPSFFLKKLIMYFIEQLQNSNKQKFHFLYKKNHMFLSVTFTGL